MNKIDLIFPLASVIIAGFCYIATNSVIYAALTLVIYICYYFILLRKKFVNYYSLITRVHSCYHFINSFIITLSVKESYEDAFRAGILLEDKFLIDQTRVIKEMNVYDRVKYLRSYFNLSIYKMFLNILDLYQDQGGNILTMSDNLIRECTRTEKTLSETLSLGYKYLIEFMVLWTMSFGIVVFIRFGIRDFYQMMLNNPIISPLIFLFFLIALVSIHLFFNLFTNLTIKEDLGSWIN